MTYVGKIGYLGVAIMVIQVINASELGFLLQISPLVVLAVTCHVKAGWFIHCKNFYILYYIMSNYSDSTGPSSFW